MNNKLCKVNYGDISINPLNYDNSVNKHLASLNGYFYESFRYYFCVEFKIVQIETNTNLFGFDFLTDPKIEQYIKFDNFKLITQPDFR